MRNDSQGDSSQYGMPVGDPLFKKSRIRYRLDMVNFVMPVARPDVLAALTPEPLVYDDDPQLLLSLAIGTELLEGFNEGERPWDEVVMKWHATFRGEDVHYNFVQYINNSVIAISARELYGQPKVPSRIEVERVGGGFNARLASWNGERELMALSFTPGPKGPERHSQPAFKLPSLTNLKQIPSAVPGKPPEVKQLVSMDYGQPVIHKALPGRGEIELLADAPQYLVDAGLSEVASAFCVDLELDVNGGHILYNYLQGE